MRRIWEVDPEILVVICSAYSDYSWEDMVSQLGRNDRFLILKKPFDNIEVRQCAMALSERWSVSRTDVLTGLLNQRAFHGHFRLEWERSARHQFPLACAMVDLDFFKRVNDTIGHQAGDFVLKSVAQQLQVNCRASDYVCRYGGEEICVLLPHTTEEGATIWAEHARRGIEASPLMLGDRAIRVTASFGVAERLADNDDMEQMLDRADQALMVAKKLGRNQVARFSTISESSNAPRPHVTPNSVFQTIQARHLMTSPMACFQATSTVGEAAGFFLQFRINSAPVVDGDGKLIGILSEKDVIAVLHNVDAWKMPIEGIMQRNVVCYEEDAPGQAICEFLGRVAVRRVVIIRDGRPTGVVSRGSLLRMVFQLDGGTHGLRSEGTIPRARPHGSHQAFSRLSDCRAVCGTALPMRCERGDDPGPPLIDRVSKLQELINDLLTSWHYANLPAVVDDDSYMHAAGILGHTSAIVD